MAVMNANEILKRGTTTVQPRQFNLALPKIPTAVQTYTPYTQMDPANYITNVAGFLPVNVQHLSNTTNGYDYNSLADVVFNYKAWQKRYGENSWLNTPLGYIPRLLWDTGLLLKDTIVDPVVDSVQLANANPNDDLGWFEGLFAGVNTAVLNTLVNVGNTLDAVANPIKGTILDGPEGFVRGLVGMEDGGRKQYDYADYIDFGPGFAAGAGELLASTALELVSDPLNWLTFGASTAAKTGANAATDAVTAGIKTTLREAVDQGLKSSDELADALVKATNGALKTADATAILKQVANDSGEIVSESVENYLKNVDNLTSAILKNNIRTNPGKNFDTSLKNATRNLATSQDTRYRAGLLKKIDYTPAVQKTASALLDNMDADSVAKSVLRLNRFDKAVDKVMATAALTASGALPIYGIKKLGVDPVIKTVKQANLERYVKYLQEHPDEIRKVLDTLDNNYKINYEQLLDEQTLETLGLKHIEPNVLNELDSGINEAFDVYSTALLTIVESKRGDAKLIKYLSGAQQDALQKINQTISTALKDYNINNLTEYIEYVHNALRVNPTSTQLKLLDKKLMDIKKLLSQDLSDAATLALHKNSGRVFNTVLDPATNKPTWTQEQSMADAASRLKVYREQQGLQLTDLEVAKTDAAALDEAVESIYSRADYILEQLPRQINNAIASEYPDTISDVVTNAVGERIIVGNYELNEYYNAFKEAHNAYETALYKADEVSSAATKGTLANAEESLGNAEKALNKAKETYVKAYNTLQEKLSKLKFSALDAPLSKNDMLSMQHWFAPGERYKYTPSVVEDARFRQHPEQLTVKSYIESLPNFSDVVKAAHEYTDGTVKLSDYFDGMLVSYTMKFDATKFALELIQDTNVETTVKQINVAEYILEQYRSGVSSAEIANYLKANNCRLFNAGDDFVWNVDEVDNIISAAKLTASNTSTTASEVFDTTRANLPQPVKDVLTVLEDWESLSFADATSALFDIEYNYPDLLAYFTRLSESTPSLKNTITNFIKQYNVLIDTPGSKLTAAKLFDIENAFTNLHKAFTNPTTAQTGTPSLKSFLKDYNGELITTETTPSAIMQVVKRMQDPNSDLYAILNNPAYADLVPIQTMKGTLNRLNDFKTLVNDFNTFLDRTPMTPVQREGFIDALVSQINHGHNFKEDKLLAIANEMYDSASLYYRVHMDVDSLAADNQFFKKASAISKEHPQYQTAQDLLASLKSGKAHMADVDNDNLWRFILLDDMLHNTLINSAGSRYIVVFDTETTGDINDPLTKVFQLAFKVLDSSGNVVKYSNYIIDPGDAKPIRTILKKVAPGDCVDIDAWWLDNIVNNPDKVADFNTAVDLFHKELTTLNTQNGFMFVGQNITNFDMKLLRTHGSVEFVELLESSKTFDTLHYLLSNNTTELFGVQKEIFVDNLAKFFETMRKNKNTALDSKLITWPDVKNLSEVKKILNSSDLDDMSFSTLKRSEREYASAANMDINLGSSYINDTVFGSDIQLLEDCIDSVLHSWRSARGKASSTLLHTVTKGNIFDDALRKTINALIEDHTITVPVGVNIMTYLNKYVSSANVHLNPRTTISYELENIFSRTKLEKAFPELVVSKDLATALTHESRVIMNMRSCLDEDVINSLKENALAFFKSDASKLSNAQYVYDAAENNMDVLVAAYVYYNNKGRGPELYNTIFKHSNSKSTPLMHKHDYTNNVDSSLGLVWDAHTNKPKAMYDDSMLYSYRQTVESSKYNPLDAISEYNVDRHIYNAHSAALDELHKADSALMLEVESYLSKFSIIERRVQESKFRKYNTSLSEIAKREILERTDRADALIKEAKLRFGRVCFTDSKDLNLDDFTAKGIHVYKTIKTTEKGEVVYVYKLCIPKNLWETAEDLVIQPTVLKHIDGIPDEVVQLVNKSRQLDTAYVHNIGKSRGDVITKELLDEFDADLPQDTLKVLISSTELESAGYFDKLHANHTFVWSSELQDVSENYITSDPFKQVFYNTERFMKQRYGFLASYINLLYNDANSINSPLFEGVLSKDLVKMFKESDMVVVYLQPGTSVWTKTGTGAKGASYRLKKIDIINDRSVELAKELGAHVIPRTQYLQMSHAINTFELPPIVKIASAISTYYKLGYLSSIGFIVRNLIDSNYKNRWALDGNVSLPKQINHLFSTINLLQDYNTIGAQYTKHIGHYFKSDLEYDVFYNVCKNSGAADIKDAVLKLYPMDTYPKSVQKRINKYLDNILEAFQTDTEVLHTLNKSLIDKKLFTCVDTFVQRGPSVGLNRSVLNNIASTETNGLHRKFVKLVTENTPMRFVYDWNDMVEQSARLSLFLQRLETGDTIDDAVRTVIKTHFDYSDKSLGMLYTEIIFPFMSFSYKNLEFWIDSVYKNPKMLRELENILRPGLNYNSLFNPDQEAYADFDYTFDWSKDVTSFEARAPWQMINAARLYHILSGNFIIDTDKIVRYDNGYGEQDAELFAVFKLSPSVLDAVRMLYNPIDTYQQRLLPPAEVLTNTLMNVFEGKAPIEDLNVNAFLNQLPLVGAPLQRAGVGNNNNITRRVQDLGLPAAVSSLFGAAYVSQKDHVYIYDGDYNVLNPKATYPRFNKMYYRGGGFNMNYIARRTYSSIYSPDVPTYRITKYARRLPNKSPYRKFKRTQVKTYYFNSLHYGMRDKLIKYRVADKFRHYD